MPKHDPVLNPDNPVDRRTLLKELDEQIRPVNCVLVLAGMYVSYSHWIQKEIEVSQKYGKPIIGIRPWGGERTPSTVTEAAAEIVGWNTDSIISAIRRQSI